MTDVLDTHTIVLFMLRWIHFIAGIIWIGHLYFFNFVNGPFAKTLDADAKRKVVPQLMPRALFWFRWGAMVTVIAGYLYIYWKLYVATNAGMRGTGGLLTSTWGQWISVGTLLGTIMWFNVWFVIWPAQQKIIGWVKAGQNPPEMAGLVAKAAKRSRINTYLSVPLLFTMGAASHFPSFDLVTVILVFAIGLGIVKGLYQLSTKVQGF